ncbi:MAG TPA: ornithine cyclodeaminase family protein [Acidobacteriota bacterium]|jgi:ornithine cyclodeaminase/alanine dehydrogenase-like protein (mu-crystallin family)|nr:ornithine cyclodeaminase family protein [Acidobacteriota bacterium]
MKILSASQTEALLPYPKLIAALQDAFAGFRSEPWIVPQRNVTHTGDGMVLTMLAADKQHLGIKTVTVFPKNAHRRLPVVQAIYLLFDGATGTPLSQLDGDVLTARRTAATTALASKFLARKDSRGLSLFGAGVQARAHIGAMLETFPEIEVVWICSRNHRHAEECAKEMAEQIRARQSLQSGSVTKSGLPLFQATDAETAARQADILCTCTTSPTPVFNGQWLKPGAHVNAVGAFQPDARELDDESIRRASIFVEIYESVLAEAGDLLIPLRSGVIYEENILGDLPALLSGKCEGRTEAEQLTLFKSTGHALEDLTAAKTALQFSMLKG